MFIKKPRVSIIILNWNGWRDTIECLSSIYKIIYPNYDVIVIDNGSKDDSIYKIKEYAKGNRENIFSDYIKIFEINENEAKIGSFNLALYEKYDPNRRLILIKNKDNYGFAGGNNIGIKFALSVLRSDYILLLNNDTVVDKTFLNELVKEIENDENIGAIGPKIYQYGKKGVLYSVGGKLTWWRGLSQHIGINELDVGQYNKKVHVDYLEGSCLLIRGKVLFKVGLLEPRYFLYWDDNDLCIRISKSKYTCVCLPNSIIWHKISSSSKGTIKTYYMVRNRFRFMKRYSSKAQLLLFFLYFFLIEIWFKSLIWLLYHRNIMNFGAFIKGVMDGVIY
ncbi:MAG: glycosyltransferase family 2 protein [Nitrososphaeria archaeon]